MKNILLKFQNTCAVFDSNNRFPIFLPRRVHVTKATYELIKDSYEVEDGKGAERNNYLRENNIQTYLIKDAKENFKQKRSIKEKRNTPGNMKRAVSNAPAVELAVFLARLLAFVLSPIYVIIDIHNEIL